jgi:hypothetical protein
MRYAMGSSGHEKQGFSRHSKAGPIMNPQGRHAHNKARAQASNGKETFIKA